MSIRTGVQTNAARKSSTPNRRGLSRRMPAVMKVGTRLAGTKRELTTTNIPRGVENQPAHWSSWCGLSSHLSGARVRACLPKNRPIE